jgi:hypothetical protein
MMEVITFYEANCDQFMSENIKEKRKEFQKNDDK